MAISFLTGESIDGGVTLTGSITFNTGGNAFITTSGGDLTLQTSTDDIFLIAEDDISLAVNGGDVGVYISGGGGTSLRYNNSQKLITTNTGVSVTGNIDLPSNGAILFDNTDNIEQYYIRNGGSSQSSLQIGKGTPGSDIKFSLDDAGNGTFSGDITVSGGDITLGGISGRIQGVVTVLSGSDATSKTYVDNAIAGAGSGTFLPLAGGTMTGNIVLNDNVKSIYGTANDGLEIYHDGSNSYIDDTGTGDLTIRASNDLRLQAASTEAYLTCNENGSVQVYYNNNLKFQTASSGATVTGALSTTTNVTVGANATFVDNGKAIFGAGSDLEIYHDGSNSYIDETGTGSLYIKSAGAIRLQSDTGENMIYAVNDGAVNLYHNGVKKFETTTTGVTVAGSRSIFAADTVVNSYSGASVIEVYNNEASSILTIHQDNGSHESQLHFRTGGNDTFIRVPASTNALQIDSETTTDAFILSHAGNGTFAGDLTVSGGDITLGGTGRIQGVDTVSANTDAANKLYVDNAVAGVGTVTGSGSNTRIAFWSSNTNLTSDADLTYATATNRLSSGNYIIPNNGDYLGTDTSGAARTLISLTSGNDVEVSNAALSSGSDTIIFFGDTFRIKDGGSTRFLIQSNGTISGEGNTFDSGPINLEEENKITFDADGDQWNWIKSNSGQMEMAVGQTLKLINEEESIYGDIEVESLYSFINSTTTANATYVAIYTDSASSTVPRRQKPQTPAQFLSNAGAVTRTGTPSNDQLTVWTNSNTVEGTSELTFSNNILAINGIVQVKEALSSVNSLYLGATTSSIYLRPKGYSSSTLQAEYKISGQWNWSEYTATAVTTTGSLDPNQNFQAGSEDTLALLAVDTGGNVVRGSQEGTWTFTKAQLDALTTTTTTGTTLIKAPGANKAVIVEESNWMIKYSGTGSMSSNGFEIRQSTNTLASAGISRIPSGKINEIMSSSQGTPANPSYGFYSRDLPQYNNDGRTFVCNKTTFINRITTNATPANLISISIKLKYRVFDSNTF